MKEIELRSLLKIKNGRDYKHLKKGDIPVFGSGGVMTYVDEFLYDKESILLPRKGSLENIQYQDKPFWTVDTLYYTEVNKNLVKPYFLYNYLRQIDLSNLNSGTGVPSMTFESYYAIKVKLPKLNIQENIANFLSVVDKKILINNQLNDNLPNFIILLLLAHSLAWVTTSLVILLILGFV